MNLSINDTIHRSLDFSESISKTDTDCPVAVAMENVPVTYWNELCTMTNSFTIHADNTDELEEKTLDLISQMELYSLCKNFTFEHEEPVIKGFNIQLIKDASHTSYRNTVNYGGEGTLDINGDIAQHLGANLTTYTDENDITHIIFYDMYDDVFSSQEEFDAIKEDFPLNAVGPSYGITEKVYGDVISLPADIIGQYIDLSDVL